jgi:CBS domain-containing protein
METGRFRRLRVIDNGKLVGIITERDLRQHWNCLDSTKLGEGMTCDPITINLLVPAEGVARLFLRHKIENGQLIGNCEHQRFIESFIERIPSC